VLMAGERRNVTRWSCRVWQTSSNVMTSLRPQIEKCRATIRDAVRYCEDGEGGARIPAAAYDSDGELDAGAIFCAMCRSKDSTDVRMAAFA